MRKSIWRIMAVHARRARGWPAISPSITPSGRTRRSTIVARPICIGGKDGGRPQLFFGAGGAQQPRPGLLCPARALCPSVKRFNRVTGGTHTENWSKCCACHWVHLTEPRISPETVIGQLCPNDQVDFLSQQLVGADRWYRVRLTQRAKDCVSTHVALGAEGWASTILVSDPSYPVEQYAQVANITLPTAIVLPTATPRPTATPKPTAVPRPTVAPTDVPALPASGGVRVGEICRDGTRSYATGRGACSHHGGVDHWLVQ